MAQVTLALATLLLLQLPPAEPQHRVQAAGSVDQACQALREIEFIVASSDHDLRLDLGTVSQHRRTVCTLAEDSCLSLSPDINMAMLQNDTLRIFAELEPHIGDCRHYEEEELVSLGLEFLLSSPGSSLLPLLLSCLLLLGTLTRAALLGGLVLVYTLHWCPGASRWPGVRTCSGCGPSTRRGSPPSTLSRVTSTTTL